RTLQRIQSGLTLLQTNPEAAEAFRFMNQAMHLQRLRSIYSEEARQGKAPELDKIPNPTWFPFQLAFILLNLPSITDLHHCDRSHETDAIADLLWFPTGGGKTEAYLGLTAYTIGLRRLQGVISGRLGTLVGLYETAVDQLCSWEVDGKKVRPKVIASTATIRQAETQKSISLNHWMFYLLLI
ncbi:hypothetical protein LC653_45300, partial [Nostoc sp. CHAB 5784]|nr:hypothetical protein [Nostoc mirabile CHAB5784]